MYVLMQPKTRSVDNRFHEKMPDGRLILSMADVKAMGNLYNVDIILSARELKELIAEQKAQGVVPPTEIVPPAEVIPPTEIVDPNMQTEGLNPQTDVQGSQQLAEQQSAQQTDKNQATDSTTTDTTTNADMKGGKV